MPSAKGHIDQRMTAEAEKISRGEKVQGRYLTYFLSQTGLPMKTVYSNVTELLLAGVDTVGTAPSSPIALHWAPPSQSDSFDPERLRVFPDLQHHVLVAVRAVPSPRGASLAPSRGAGRAGW